MKDNNKMNYTISRHPEVTRAEDVRREPYPFNASVKNPKDLQTQSHVITRNNVEQMTQKSTQRDVVIPNKLGNSKTCLGLLRRFVYKITNNNEISPHNDMNNKNRNELINLSTYRLIDFKKKIAFTLAEGATHVDLPPTKVKLAFTLAEVLITLGIIGIVAAMTIPSMISNFQKREIETRLKEDYSIFSQVNKMMIENDVAFNMAAIDNDTQKLRDWLDKYAFPYMKVARICNDPTIGCWSGSATYLNGRSFGDCKAGGCGANWVSFVMNNGTKVATDIGDNGQLKGQMGVDSEADSCLKMYVDVNGDKKPNKFGVDIFLMTFTEDGFMPAGYTKTPEDLAKNCSPTNYGTWCMTHVKNSNWTIPDDVWKSRNKK